MTGNSFYSIEKHAQRRSGGTTQSESHVYNQRLLLSLIRRRSRLTKVELTRLTGLSSQTVATLVNRAADQGLLIREPPIRGRIGQPSAPYSLDSTGAYSFGLSVGYRRAHMLLIDFLGNIVARDELEYGHPMPDEVIDFTRKTVRRFAGQYEIPEVRICGLGVAFPADFNSKPLLSIVPPGISTKWKEIDIRAVLDAAYEWPVYLMGDTIVAGCAELLFGAGREVPDFLYCHIGHSLGGAVIVDDHLFAGRNQRAGAIGNLPQAISTSSAPLRRHELGSLASLEELAGLPLGALLSGPCLDSDWDRLGPVLQQWEMECAGRLAFAMASAAALFDIFAFVIDGYLPRGVLSRVVRATRAELGSALSDRDHPFSVLEGTFGLAATALGGATIPMLVNYSNDKETLFKD